MKKRTIAISVMFIIIVFIFAGCGKKSNIRKEIFNASVENYEYILGYMKYLEPQVDGTGTSKTYKLSDEIANFNTQKIADYYTEMNKKYKNDMTEEEKKVVESIFELSGNLTLYRGQLNQFTIDSLNYQLNLLMFGGAVSIQTGALKNIEKHINGFEAKLTAMQEDIDYLSEVLEAEKLDYPTKALEKLKSEDMLYVYTGKEKQ